MKGLTVGFTEHFWGGLLVGAILSGLLVAGLAFERIEAHSKFENKLIKQLFAAAKEVEKLQEKCGKQCDKIVLTYPDLTN